MPREKEGYRDNLELLIAFFPDKRLLTVQDISRWSGLTVETIKKHYFGERKYMSIAEVARKIS